MLPARKKREKASRKATKVQFKYNVLARQFSLLLPENNPETYAAQKTQSALNWTEREASPLLTSDFDLIYAHNVKFKFLYDNDSNFRDILHLV